MSLLEVHAEVFHNIVHHNTVVIIIVAVDVTEHTGCSC